MDAVNTGDGDSPCSEDARSPTALQRGILEELDQAMQALSGLGMMDKTPLSAQPVVAKSLADLAAVRFIAACYTILRLSIQTLCKLHRHVG